METLDVISNKHLNAGQMTVISGPLCVHSELQPGWKQQSHNKEKQMCEQLDIYLPVFRHWDVIRN